MKIAGVVIAFVVLSFGAFLVLNRSDSDSETANNEEVLVTTPVIVPAGKAVATFAGGCFWCVEAVFQEQAGIDDVISGYGGGQEENPTYEQVAFEKSTGHREAIQFFYDPNVISYDEILDIFWRSIDPTDAGGQFVDRGYHYTTAVYYHDESQRAAAKQSITVLSQDERFQGFPIVTEVLPYTTFYPAEEFHQDYYIKAPTQYKQYESASGREEYKAAIWADFQDNQ